MACFAFFAQSTALQMVNSVDLPVRHLGRHRSRLPASGLLLSCHGIFCTEVQDRNFRVSAFGSTIRDPIPTPAPLASEYLRPARADLHSKLLPLLQGRMH